MSNNILKASFFSVLSEAISKIIGPIGFIILTSILSPTDFGIVAVGSSILMIVNIIADLGVSKVLIQQSNDDLISEKFFDNGFTINFILGLILFLILFSLSKLIANFFNIPESFLIIRLISIQIIFQSISSVHIALRKKKMDFKFLFYLRVVTSFVPLMISIPFALNGYGYLSIVYSQLATVFVSSIILWNYSDWKPKIRLNKEIVKSILSKSVWSSVEEITIIIPFVLDTFLISNFIDQHSLGIYSTSRTLFRTFFALILGSLSPVIFSHLSKIKDDNRNFTSDVIKFFKLTSFIVVIFGLLIQINKELIEYVFFDADWTGISNILGILFSIMSITYISSTLEDAIRAKGLFKELAINRICITALSSVFLFYTVKFGLDTYVLLRSILLLILIPMNLKIVHTKLKINYKIFIKNVKYLFLFYFLIQVSNYFIINISDLAERLIMYNSIYIILMIILIYLERTFFKKFILKISDLIRWKNL
jgi:O-antigen/teichoic acid export membrane protein